MNGKVSRDRWHVLADFADIRSCGSTIGAVVRGVARTLLVATASQAGAVASLNERPRSSLQLLLSLADDHINSVDFHDVQARWLRLYTDCSLLLSAYDVLWGLACHDELPRQFFVSAVQRLDTAVIIAGAVGRGRREWASQLITCIQSTGLPRISRPLDPVNTAPKRRRVLQEGFQPSCFAAERVQELSAAPSVHDYVKHHSSAPFIVRNYFASETAPTPPWPALQRWRSADYLLDRVGEGRYVPVEIGGAYVDSDWTQKILPFRTFLARAGFDVEAEADDESASGAIDPDQQLYLAQHSLFSQFPNLQQDFSIPDYVWSEPPVKEGTHYKEIEASEIPIINVWVGNSRRHPVSPAHTVSFKRVEES